MVKGRNTFPLKFLDTSKRSDYSLESPIPLKKKVNMMWKDTDDLHSCVIESGRCSAGNF